MAAVAILLAVYQYKKEDWEIALEVRSYIVPTVTVLISLGFAAILFSSVVSFWRPTNILLLSTFWQILASILITSAIVFLFLKATNRRLFNSVSAHSFISALLRRVSSRSPKQLDMAVNVIAVNFKTIVKEVTTIPHRGEVSELKKCAHFVMTQIISNPDFAHHVVTTRADFLQRFLHTIKDDGLYSERDFSPPFNALIKALFLNRDSYFYRELKHSEPGVYYKPFLEDVFKDQQMLLEFRPFDQIAFGHGETIEPEKLSLFITALETALEGYFSEPRSMDFEYSHYRWVFEKVENVLSRAIEELRRSDSKDNWHIVSKIHEITFFAGWHFQRIYKEALKNGKVSQHDIDAPIEEKSYGIYPHSMTSGYAQLIFKLLCELSDYSDGESARHYAMTLADHILIFNEPEFENIRKVLLRFIWEKINGKDAPNIDGYYPLILPTFLALTGMWQDSSSPERKALYNQTVEFLNKELKPKLLANTKMANDDSMEERLLGSHVVFNREKGLFQWKMHKSMQDMVVRQ